MTVHQLAHRDVWVEEGGHPGHVVYVLDVEHGVDEGHAGVEVPVSGNAADLDNPELIVKRRNNLRSPTTWQAVQHLTIDGSCKLMI